MTVEMMKKRRAEGEAVGSVCRRLGIHRSSYYDWRRPKPAPAKRSGPPGPPPALLRAMQDDVRRLDHVKRRTWGTATIYEDYQGLIPRRVIQKTIRQERRAANRIDRAGAQQYEFCEVGVAFSVDFKKVLIPGRLIRVQDERSRCMLDRAHRRSWPAEEVTRWVRGVFERTERPLVVKHDRGTEFDSRVFQDMLQELKIVALPSPGAWPRYNGKHERWNKDIQQWLIPAAQGHLDPDQVLEEVDLAIEDLNEIKPRRKLGWRTPLEVYKTSPRVKIDREDFYRQWLDYRHRMRLKHAGDRGIITDELTVLRLAAVAVLQEHGLLKYYSGRRPHTVNE